MKNPNPEKRTRSQNKVHLQHTMNWKGSLNPTFQHAEVHGIIGSLWHTKHHLQAILNLTFTFFTAREQLLKKTSRQNDSLSFCTNMIDNQRVVLTNQKSFLTHKIFLNFLTQLPNAVLHQGPEQCSCQVMKMEESRAAQKDPSHLPCQSLLHCTKHLLCTTADKDYIVLF